MANPKLALALDIIGSGFGVPAKTICTLLVERGVCELAEITSKSGLDKELVKAVLLAGIHNNFILAFDEVRDNVARHTSITTTYYRFLTDNALMRLRFPLYVMLFAEKYNDATKDVIQILLQKGRASGKAILEEFYYDGTAEQSRQAFWSAFKFLKDKRYIIPLPLSNQSTQTMPCRSKTLVDQSIQDDEPEMMSPTKQRGRKPTASQGTSSQADGTKTIMISATSSKNKKPTLTQKKTLNPQTSATSHAVSSALALYDMDVTSSSSPTPPITSTSSKTPTPPPTDSSGMQVDNPNLLSENTLVQFENDETKWYVDYDRLHYEYFKDSCISYAHERVDQNAGLIVQELFELTTASANVSEERLLASLSAAHKLGTVTSKEQIRRYLEIMSRASKAPILIKIASPLAYSVNSSVLLEVLQKLQVESIIQDKFGVNGVRIFRILMDKKLLEQKQISEFAMLPIKETRDTLYQMLSKKYISLQEVPRTQENNPAKTFYLWHINWKRLLILVTNEAYKTIRNLRQRHNFIVMQHRDILQKKDEQDRIASTGETLQFLTQAEGKILEELDIIFARLEQAIARVDKTIMILQDFYHNFNIQS